MIVHETAITKLQSNLNFYRSHNGLHQWTRVHAITEAVEGPEIQNVKLSIKHVFVIVCVLFIDFKSSNQYSFNVRFVAMSYHGSR